MRYSGIIKRLSFSLFLLLLTAGVRGQSDKEFYTTLRTSEARLLRAVDSLNYLDSTLHDFHLYSSTFRSNFGHMDLGNSGSAQYPLVYRVSQTNGFDLGWHSLDANRFLYSEESPLFRAKKPITSLFYAQGPNELIHLQALHSQNIKPNWNVGVEFRRLKEDGFYLRQETGQYNTRVYSWYHSKDYRYHLIASAVWNRNKNQENGGIYSKESFDTLTGIGRNPLVKYYTSPVWNTLRSNTFSVTQIYRLGQKRHFPTEATDSLGRAIQDTTATFIPQRQVSIKTSFQTYANIFEVEGFVGMPFDKFYTDSARTFDSTWYRNANVTLGYQSGAFRRLRKDSLNITEKPVYFMAFVDVNLIKVGWHVDHAAYSNIGLRAELGTRSWIKDREGLMTKAFYGLSGYNAGDWDYQGLVRKSILWVTLQAEVHGKQYAPDFFQYYYFGNHHFWYNKNFQKQQALEFSGTVSNSGPKEWISLRYSSATLGNLIYLGAGETPLQAAGNIQVQQAELRLKANWKWLHFNGLAVWQKSSAPHILPLPRWALKQSLFAQGWMFKKALFAKAGVDLFWCERFAAAEYVAPLRSWKLQDPANPFTIGNYPFINVYAAGRIKTVTFFLMFQHVTAGLFGPSYYASPYHPMQPRAFRLGIKWDLYE